MVTLMNLKTIRKPDALHRARVEALRERKTLGEWIEEAIDEKIQRKQKKE
jgi:predicted HicB family RNase H-like nuclease